MTVHSYTNEDLQSIDEVSKTVLGQVEEFFISYNKQRGKKFAVTGTGGPKKAIEFLEAGIAAYKKKSKKTA